jgi:exosome complex component RRP4
VTSQKLIDVSMRGPGLRKLVGGTVITVNAQKVPRIIGRKGSMVGMIKKATDCNIVVGQNGRVWLMGAPAMEATAIDAIRMIEKNAHKSGLTDRVAQMLKERTGRDVQPTEDTALGSGDEREQTSVIRSTVQRDSSQLGGFRQGGFRKGAGNGGGFRNTNNRNNENNNHNNQSNQSRSEGGAE